MGRVPEIFIVGTMKGGTTILYDYLCTHPRVVAGKQKEIHYFSMYANKGPDWYRSNFPDRAEDILSIDASPTYYDVATMPTIPAFLKEAVPAARIILMARNPIDRAVSHFQHLRTITHKELFKDVDINEFFSRPLERCYTCLHETDVQLGHVLGFSVYDAKFSNYASVFGHANVLVLTNDQLRSDPLATMKRVFEHCGLEWAASDLFGTQRYLSGSERLKLDQSVRERLESLFSPSYARFCRRSGISNGTVSS